MTWTTRKPAAYAALLLALLAAVVLATPGGTPRAAAARCPAGYQPQRVDRSGAAWVTRLRELTEASAPARGCVRVVHPESAADMARANDEQAARETGPFASVRPGAQEAAMKRHDALAASGIPGTTGRWFPVGNTPLIANDPEYGSINGEGLANIAGRIQDFTYDNRPGKDIVYVATAQGGVWRSLDRGDHWTSVSDTLPNLTTGSVAWSPGGSAAGTLVVVTGDSNGGGNSYSGTGVYRSVDGGKSWTHASGVPSGLLGFRIAADPTNAQEFYAATGGGLFRSTDGAKTFTNVSLPTGACAGKPAAHPCFFANQVTDVVVQSPDQFGHAGGKVVAVVGWRAGRHVDRDGHEQAPGNGLYGSPTGAPGSFTKLAATGFASNDRVGRTELGAATGRLQDHEILYAVVQDAEKFNSGVPVTDANEAPAPVLGVNNVLAGIYVSRDFGQTWTLMEDGEVMAQNAGAEGSALAGYAQTAGLYAPGVQAWYNEWIKPDPSRTDATTHAPTRLLFGLEEIWQNEDTPVGVPMVGPTTFHVIGRYFAGNTCFFLDLGALPYCPTYRGEPQHGTTTHPDQHGAIFLPGPGEGVTLLVGNDGGVYRQVDKGSDAFTNAKWGTGQQDGFHTLLPYGVAVAKDGVVWAGLQDNGQLKIERSGKQLMTFGGDGTWALVDPNDSDTAIESQPGGILSYTTDGGRNWADMDPGTTGAAFVTQFAMDPKDSAHIGMGGEQVVEQTDGPAAASHWKTVFDLGTVDHPGATPGPTDMSATNRVSAIDISGNATYVGWCGICDVVTGSGTFKSGIATNQGGAAPGEAGSTAGWHIAAANGLPQRYITSVHVDPDHPRTVYVTLGGYSRVWVPPGANGDAAAAVGSGHLFRSTDAGEHFTDISGSLPDTPAGWVTHRGNQLIVATDVGVYISPTRNGGTWGLLGPKNNLPNAPVYNVVMRPGDPNELYASSYGRGIYRYRFDGTNPPVYVPPGGGGTEGRGGGPKIPTTGLPVAIPALAAVLTGVAAAAVRRRRAGAAPGA